MVAKYLIMSKSIKWKSIIIIISISINVLLHLCGTAKLFNREMKNTDCPVLDIMNVMFGYFRMLLSGAPYWGSSTWVRTKGAKVAWWSTSPRLRAWLHLQVVLFMLPRSMQLSALLAPLE
jgi:hypothetical protein